MNNVDESWNWMQASCSGDNTGIRSSPVVFNKLSRWESTEAQRAETEREDDRRQCCGIDTSIIVNDIGVGVGEVAVDTVLGICRAGMEIYLFVNF